MSSELLLRATLARPHTDAARQQRATAPRAHAAAHTSCARGGRAQHSYGARRQAPHVRARLLAPRLTRATSASLTRGDGRLTLTRGDGRLALTRGDERLTLTRGDERLALTRGDERLSACIIQYPAKEGGDGRLSTCIIQCMACRALMLTHTHTHIKGIATSTGLVTAANVRPRGLISSAKV